MTTTPDFIVISNWQIPKDFNANNNLTLAVCNTNRIYINSIPYMINGNNYAANLKIFLFKGRSVFASQS